MRSAVDSSWNSWVLPVLWNEKLTSEESGAVTEAQGGGLSFFPLRSLWCLGLCPHAPWFRVSRCLPNRWKNMRLPGGKKQESKRASRLVPDRFDSHTHSLGTSSSLLQPEPWYLSTPGSRESWKIGLCLFVCLFSSCDCREGKNKEACERDVVHESHRAFVSLLSLLRIFFICHDESVRLVKESKEQEQRTKCPSF